MRLSWILALPCFVSCAAVPSSAPAPDSTGVRENRLSLYLGQRRLDEDDWEPVDEQPTFGIEFSQERTGSAVGWEVGAMGSSDEDEVAGFDVEASTGELYGGVRKTFGEGPVRPYVGGGLSVIRLEGEISGIGDDEDTSLAAYAHGGVAFAVSEAFLIGLDLRFLFGSDMDIAGFDTDADYGQFALVFVAGL